MAETKIKAAQFHGVVGHGTDGYFLMTNADGSMSWSQASTGPSVTSVTYPGDDTAADPAGAQSIVLTGTNFGSSMSVSIGGTTASSVAHDSSTQLTITAPAKAAGDYDIVVTNTVTGASGTFVNGISYNGVPTWTTATGSLGTFDSETTISTITLAATEPDGGTITFNITNGALPTGLSLTGANIDGTTTAESSTTLYSFTIEAIDDENQATPRNFSITVNSSEIVPSQHFTINTYTGNGSTQSIEGKIGTSASFNGSSSYITTSNPFSGQSGSNQEYSVSLWFKGDSFTNVTYPTLFKGFNSSNNGQTPPFVWTNGSIIRFHGYKYGDATVSLNTGQWYHLVVIENGDSIEIYLDGVSQTLGALTTWDQVNADQIKFGADSASLASTAFDGSIDQIRIFDRALLSSEVTTLYGESNTSTTISTTDIFDDGSAVALYEFEEGAKDTGGVSGKIGSGGIFDGSSSYISTSIPNNDIEAFSFWMYFVSGTTVHRPLGSTVSSGGGNLAVEVSTNGTITCMLQNLQAATSSGALGSTGWKHIYYDTSRNLYINGVLQSTTNSSTSFPASNLLIGALRTTYGFFEGKIDQIRIFNRVLDETNDGEVTTLYNETSATADKSKTDIFDDGSGVALYELEGNANGTSRGAIDDGQSGSFDGTNYITLTGLPTSTTGSYSFWVNPSNASSSGFKGILGNQTAGGQLFTDAGALKIYASTTRTFSGSPTLADNTWSHVVLSISGGTGTIYVNGISKGTASSLSLPSTSYIATASTQVGTGTYMYAGLMDEVRIYSSALSVSDVEALFSETNVPTANLVAHYKLDGDAIDETTNYNGTWSGTEAYSDPAEFPTYDGTPTNVTYGYDGTSTNVSFVGTSFQPDLVWTKGRTVAYDHGLVDSVRGASSLLYSSLTGTATPTSTAMQSFDSNGFTWGSNNKGNAGNSTYVAWMWKAADTTTTITAGTVGNTIASYVRANQDAGFSIVSYTGTAANATVGHGLSSAPELIIFKNLDSTSHWDTYSVTIGATKRLQLSTTGAASSASSAFFNNTDPTDSVFSVGSGLHTNGDDDGLIAYCFHSVPGYQKVGSYTGNNPTSSTIRDIDVGFTPRFLLLKNTTTTGPGWNMYDNLRGNNNIFANVPNTESDYSSVFEFTNNGFRLKSTNTNTNYQTNLFIYLAIA